jgi:hypothetical protein
MFYLMILIIIIAVGILNMTCFLMGAKLAQSVENGEPIKLPTMNPMEKIRERQDKKEAQRTRDKFEVLMQNVDNYDGTGTGQKDIPRG